MKKAIYALLSAIAGVFMFSAILLAGMKLIFGVVMFFAGAAMI